MKSHYRVVVVGGGMMGVGLLYHLAEEGWDDILLVEKGELTSGSTWHAAGQCPSFIADYNMALVHHHSNTLYPKLEAMTGQPTGWHGPGGIRFAITQEEVDYFHYVESVASNVGFRMQVVGPDEIKRINPFVDTTGVLAGAWTLDDGYVDPSSCCNAMAIGARNMGATIVKNNRVLDILALPSGEWNVVTQQGSITCEHVVNAAGCYAERVSDWVGTVSPITNILHQYVVTDEIPEFAASEGEIPVMRDPYASAYYRQELNSGLIGIYERSNTREAWRGVGQDWDSENELFEPDYEPIMPWLERVMERMPIWADAGIMRVVHGAISHTIDSNPLLGPAAGVRNFWHANGSSIGIAQGAGCGKYLAQWMVHGSAEINMIGMDPRRFGGYADKDYVDAKSHQEYWDMYDLVVPGEERPAGRGARQTPLYDRLAAQGCVFTESFGWERPKWFSLDGVEEDYGFRRNNIFEVIGDEHRAVRERVGLFELPSFSKFEVSGPDAESYLNRMLANTVSKRIGGVVLTHALGENGRIETEFTITRLSEESFYLLSGAVAEIRDWDRLNFGLQAGDQVTLKNVTTDYTSLVLAGPHARAVLSKLTDQDLTNASFRWLRGKEIEVAGVPVRALRVNYVGELGWELHVKMEDVLALYDALWAAGQEFGIANFGTYAMNTLRIEKAYAGWGVELTNEITLMEADMERFVKWDHDFVGKEATLARKDAEHNLVKVYCEVAATDSDIRGGEGCFAGEDVIGLTTSGGYGYTVEKSLAFAYVKPAYAEPGTTFEIDVLGEKLQAVILADPAYDPSSARLRA
jgi:dimethylglycine dehydrogenase